MLQREDLEQCSRLGNRYVCLPRFAIRNAMIHPTCEISLLLNPNQEALKICDIRITRSTATEWTNLITSNKWLFSSLQAESGTIVCGTKYIDTIKIIGTGILTLGQGCVLKTPTDTITSVGNLALTDTEISLPPLNLTIPEVTKILDDNSENVTKLLDKIHINSLPDLHTYLQNEQQLDENQKRLNEIGQMKQEMYNHKWFTFGTIGSLSFLSLCGILYGLYRWNNLYRIYKCCIQVRRNTKKTSANKTEPVPIQRAASEPTLLDGNDSPTPRRSTSDSALANSVQGAKGTYAIRHHEDQQVTSRPPPKEKPEPVRRQTSVMMEA